MKTNEKLKRYRDAMVKWKLQVARHFRNPFAGRHSQPAEPTLGDYQLTTHLEVWAARAIRERVSASAVVPVEGPIGKRE